MLVRIARCTVTGLILALLTTGVAQAKEERPFKAVIAGPGLEDGIEIMAPGPFRPLSTLVYTRGIDYQTVEEPRNPGEGFVVTLYVRSVDTNGRFTEGKPWVRVTYYPRPYGQPGVVHYEGLIGANWGRFWYQAPPEADAAMRQVLTQHLPPPGRLAWEALLQGRPSRLIVFGLAALIVMLGTAAARRRALRQ